METLGGLGFSAADLWVHFEARHAFVLLDRGEARFGQESGGSEVSTVAVVLFRSPDEALLAVPACVQLFASPRSAA